MIDVWVERMCGIVTHALDDTETFGSTLPEQHSITDRQEFRSLHEPESNQSTVTSSDVGTIYIDDGTGLANSSNMQHGLIPGTNGGGMRQNEH
jgi:hypothetical protein